MDKYEFNIKVEQIRKLVSKGDYETAMKIADTIDWKKVRNANLLSLVSQVYEKNEEYQDAKDILLLAFERAPIGKRLLYKLTELALKEDNTDEAEAYYREFCDLAGDDPRQHLLRFMILKKKEAPVEQLIHSLEGYTSEELDEKWLYELAELYHEAGDSARCVSTCDKIMLMFGLGKYVDKAMELKLQYAPLTKYQMDLVENREKYEEKLRAVEQSFEEENENDLDYAESEPVADNSVRVQTRQGDTEELTENEVPHAAEESVAVTEEVVAETTVEITDPSEEHAELKAEKEAEAAVRPEPAAEAVAAPKSVKRGNHLMIEARTPDKGLELAVETLRKIQRETGIKNPVAKITGSKLNKRGILANADKLAGKDLMIEEAGDLTSETIRELEQFMAQDTAGIRVILIDNPRQMEMLHEKNPSLAATFQWIASSDAFKGSKPKTSVDVPESAGVSEHAETTENPGEEDSSESKSEAEPEIDNRPVRRVVPVRDGAMRAPEKRELRQEVISGTAEDDEEELDIDDFAQYACKYAAEIDCSITGKSMLALYERIEIMEEDGIALTRSAAEALIEEAADRAEKPGLGKAIKGLFSSKYDKDGLLILKEEHFIS